MLSALRSFLRHLQLRGDIGAELAACVPCVPRWGLTEVPKFLPPGAVQQVLKHCERRSAEGMRDYAILLLLARLGLRAGEVVSLSLDDIDWRAGQLALHCKGQRSAQVPLITEVGEALARYLERGRPHCATRRVFIRGRAPRVGFQQYGKIVGLLHGWLPQRFSRRRLAKPINCGWALRYQYVSLIWACPR
jgi:integrase